MDFVKKFFPLSVKFTGETKQFVIGIVINALVWIVAPWVIGTVAGAIGGLITFIPFLGWVLGPVIIVVGGFAGTLVGLYGLAGLVLNILVQTKVIK